MKIKIEVSARHIHLSQEHLDSLFGKGHKLTKKADLSQEGEFACEETLQVVGPKNKIEKVRIIGPVRPRTQVEVSKTDGFMLGNIPPLRVSGDVVGSAPIKLIGPNGSVDLLEGLILAMRHIHISEKQAKELNLKDGQRVSVSCFGDRGLLFNNVVVRVKENFQFFFQIDTDEANSAGVENGDIGELIVKK
ncbi:MAG: phosphate propanoyltransferase [Patescibacteria group bacterium]|nr:phosphate propanoyltransferase [Patescibacteria group bacterium]